MVTKAMNETQTIRLSHYQPSHYAALNKFYLPKEQLRFTALPSEILEKSLQEPNRYPIIILSAETPVGFFVLGSGEMVRAYINNPNALLLFSFSINRLYQGNGYAKKALFVLRNFVLEHFPGTDEIILTVNEENLPAKQLYEKSGFQDKGMKKLGTTGIESIMHYPV